MSKKDITPSEKKEHEERFIAVVDGIIITLPK